MIPSLQYEWGDGVKISACWIAKNEENKLPRSVASVKDAVDEMVVLDTGSTDGTVRVAEELGAKVHTFAWTNDFAAARNRCMELAESEIVIFLDADEWFEPALTAKDHDRLLKLFGRDHAIEAIQLGMYNVDDHGGVLDLLWLNRILRKRPGLSFQGRVHEQYLREGGKRVMSTRDEQWKLLHDGYAPSILAGKVARNVPLLEQTAQGDDRAAALFAHCYLLREYSYKHEKAELLTHLRSVLDNAELLKPMCQNMGESVLELFPYMVDTAIDYLDNVSATEMNDKIVAFLEKEYPRHPYSVIVRLYWDYRVEDDESLLLAGLDGALAAIRRMPATPYRFYIRDESRLLLWAALAAERRGETERAVGYAAAALRTGKYHPGALHVLLRHWRGTPLDAVEKRLGEIFLAMDRAALSFVAKCGGIYGYEGLSVACVQKLAENDWLDGEYLFAYLLLTGKPDEAADMAKRDGGAPYAAFEAWELAKGMNAEAKGKYFLSGGMYEDILAKTAVDPVKTPELVGSRIRSFLYLGRYKEALTELLPYLSAIPVEKDWMQCLQVVAEKLGGELGQMARNVWGLSQRYNRRLREWGGVARSGYAAERYDKKQKSALTRAMLEQAAAEERGELATEALLDFAEKAAGIYESKRMAAMALECLTFARAHGREHESATIDKLLFELGKDDSSK